MAEMLCRVSIRLLPAADKIVRLRVVELQQPLFFSGIRVRFHIEEVCLVHLLGLLQNCFALRMLLPPAADAKEPHPW